MRKLFYAYKISVWGLGCFKQHQQQWEPLKRQEKVTVEFQSWLNIHIKTYHFSNYFSFSITEFLKFVYNVLIFACGFGILYVFASMQENFQETKEKGHKTKKVEQSQRCGKSTCSPGERWRARSELARREVSKRINHILVVKTVSWSPDKGLRILVRRAKACLSGETKYFLKMIWWSAGSWMCRKVRFVGRSLSRRARQDILKKIFIGSYVDFSAQSHNLTISHSLQNQNPKNSISEQKKSQSFNGAGFTSFVDYSNWMLIHIPLFLIKQTTMIMGS